MGRSPHRHRYGKASPHRGRRLRDPLATFSLGVRPQRLPVVAPPGGRREHRGADRLLAALGQERPDVRGLAICFDDAHGARPGPPTGTARRSPRTRLTCSAAPPTTTCAPPPASWPLRPIVGPERCDLSPAAPVAGADRAVSGPWAARVIGPAPALAALWWPGWLGQPRGLTCWRLAPRPGSRPLTWFAGSGAAAGLVKIPPVPGGRSPRSPGPRWRGR
jgi:hypothetical protein